MTGVLGCFGGVQGGMVYQVTSARSLPGSAVLCDLGRIPPWEPVDPPSRSSPQLSSGAQTSTLCPSPRGLRVDGSPLHSQTQAPFGTGKFPQWESLAYRLLDMFTF